MIKVEGAESFIEKQDEESFEVVDQCRRMALMDKIVLAVAYICAICAILVFYFLPEQKLLAIVLVVMTYAPLIKNILNKRKMKKMPEVKDICMLNSMAGFNDNSIRFYMKGEKSFLYHVHYSYLDKKMVMNQVPCSVVGVNDDDEISIARPDYEGKVLLFVSHRLEKLIDEYKNTNN